MEPSYDWIVVGSGVSGLSGALWASRRGLKTLLIEKASVVGGSTAYSYGSLWVPNNPLEREAGIEDSEESAVGYMEYLSGGFAEAEKLITYVREAPLAIEELIGWGVKLRLIEGVADHYFPIAPGSLKKGRMLEAVPIPRHEMPAGAPPLQRTPYMPEGISWTEAIRLGGLGNRFRWDRQRVQEASSHYAAGQGIVAGLLRACLEGGATIHLGTAATRLLQENGRVVGIEVDRAGSPEQYRARRGVFIATGGYENNPEMVRAFQWFPESVSHYPPTQTGDGMVLAMEIGAAIRVIPVSLASMVGYWIPREDGTREFHSSGIQELAYPHSMVVNSEGRRFADESFFQVFTVKLRDFDVLKSHRYKNIPCYLIFDTQFASRYPFAENPPGASVPAWVNRANSWQDLAKRLDVDGEQLERTVAVFNDEARFGRDPEFGRGGTSWGRSVGDPRHPLNPNVAPLEQPPFYGVELFPTESSSAGLYTDVCGRVRSVRGAAIEGLYAGGIVTARTEYGAGYQAGFSLASGITFARLAVAHAMTAAERPAIPSA
jgi:3-oxosteroid 1-dehydrogenase